jgi:hypothetical protein
MTLVSLIRDHFIKDINQAISNIRDSRGTADIRDVPDVQVDRGTGPPSSTQSM